MIGSLITSVLAYLGLGGSVMTGAVLLLVAFYLYRGVSAGRTVATLAGSLAAYALVLLVAVGFAIVLGWIDPHPGTAFEDVTTAVRMLIEAGSGPMGDVWTWIRGSV
ncbi:hypothetical protein ACFSBX_14490 [Halobellus rarus]|uniref:Uncharacterized protein n=2 Tax=Halobellus rarus TaxID=1126237 RepID=A0ABD6CQ34_9EURY